jgi:hypothetical protein
MIESSQGTASELRRLKGIADGDRHLLTRQRA